MTQIMLFLQAFRRLSRPVNDDRRLLQMPGPVPVTDILSARLIQRFNCAFIFTVCGPLVLIGIIFLKHPLRQATATIYSMLYISASSSGVSRDEREGRAAGDEREGRAGGDEREGRAAGDEREGRAAGDEREGRAAGDEREARATTGRKNKRSLLPLRSNCIFSR